MSQQDPLGSGRIETREVEEEMRTSFLDYAMSVIVSRALPDVRDGLKPVHRRVLYAMSELWLQPGGHTEEEDATVFDAALREACEETGIAAFDAPLGRAILDVDVHPIPARGRDAAHLHFDVRYLLTSRSDADPDASDDPTRPMRWSSFEEAMSLGIDASLERALNKARRALGVLSKSEG